MCSEISKSADGDAAQLGRSLWQDLTKQSRRADEPQLSQIVYSCVDKCEVMQQRKNAMLM